jgi:hypothetical protein
LYVPRRSKTHTILYTIIQYYIQFILPTEIVYKIVRDFY